MKILTEYSLFFTLVIPGFERPKFSARISGQRVEAAIGAADKDASACDRGRGFDRLACRECPAQFQRIRQFALGHALEFRATPEHGPGGGERDAQQEGEVRHGRIQPPLAAACNRDENNGDCLMEETLL